MASKSRKKTADETRSRLVEAGRRAFARLGYASASMDDIATDAGVTRGALYHAFGGKRGLLAAVVAQVDGEMAASAREIGARVENEWASLRVQGEAYIEMALDPEIQRIVLFDGPAELGDPSQWPSQNACLIETHRAVASLIEQGMFRPVDPEAAARLLCGAALNAALWVAAAEAPDERLPRAIEAFRCLLSGFRA